MPTKKRKSQARKTSALPTRIFTYGVPVLSEDDRKIVNEQIFRAHRYRNKRIEIERERRDDYRKIRASLSSKLGDLEEAYQKSQDDYLAARRNLYAIPKADRETSPNVAEVKALGATRNGIWELVKAERKTVESKHFAEANAEFALLKDHGVEEEKSKHPGTCVGPHTKRKLTERIREQMRANSSSWPEAWKQKDSCQEASEKKQKTARKQSGCLPGVYLAVDAAAQRSFMETKFNPPFLTFDHTGKVGSQVTEKVTIDDALKGRSKIIHIEMQPEVHVRGAQSLARRGARTDVGAAIAHLRLGSKPVTTLSIPFVMHRPMPEGTIKWIYLKVDRIGLRTVYEIQFTIESADFSKPPIADGGTLAINVGWRRLDNGDICVATTFDGVEHEKLVVPGKIHDTIESTEKEIGYCEDHFNAARGVLRRWLETNSLSPETSEKLKLSSVAQWRSHGNLAKTAFVLRDLYLADTSISDLWREWRLSRIPLKPGAPHRHGSQLPKERLTRKKWAPIRPRSKDLLDTFETLSRWFDCQGVTDPNKKLALYLEWWRRKDEHLQNIARASAKRALLHRRELYRRTAHAWAKQYRDVVFENWDKRKTAETPTPEMDTRTKQEENANSLRQVVGVSVLLDAVEQAFGKKQTFKVESKDISRVHFTCGGQATSTLNHHMVKCDKCGRLYDQDINAAMTMWHRHREGSGGTETPTSARVSNNLNDVDEVAAAE
jgi:hypothetical protein